MMKEMGSRILISDAPLSLDQFFSLLQMDERRISIIQSVGGLPWN